MMWAPRRAVPVAAADSTAGPCKNNPNPDSCGKAFSHTSGLDRHFKMHSPDRLLHCRSGTAEELHWLEVAVRIMELEYQDDIERAPMSHRDMGADPPMPFDILYIVDTQFEGLVIGHAIVSASYPVVKWSIERLGRTFFLLYV